MSVGEFLEGEADRAWALGWLKQFSRPIPITSTTARIMADIQRGAGKRLGENDAWMAASAIEHSSTLLSTDKAFGGVKRLRWHTYGRD